MVKINLHIDTLQKLEQLFGRGVYNFLGFNLNLKEGTVTGALRGKTGRKLTEWQIQLLATLLTHYSYANLSPMTGNLIKFKDLPGGCAYEGAFNKRAINPIADFFGVNPQDLISAGELFGATPLSHGDASVQITPLPGIPLTYILWGAGEFAASANILYDKSANNYLPTEDLAVLGELTTARLIEAKMSLPKK